MKLTIKRKKSIPERRLPPVFLALALLLTGCASQESGQGDLPLTEEPLYGKFIWHDLITDDEAAARAFYGALFGWTFEDTETPNGADYTLIISRQGRYVGGIVELEDPESADFSRWLGYFAVPDVDGATSATEQAGGRIVVGSLDLGRVARVAAVQDPQGAVVGLIESRIGYPDDSFRGGPGYVRFNELLTSDEVAAAAFYADLGNGMEVIEDVRPRGVYRYLGASGLRRAGVMRRPDDQVEPLWLTHFEVRDPQLASDRVAELGGTVIVPPLPDLRDGSLALVTDPGGALLALSRPVN